MTQTIGEKIVAKAENDVGEHEEPLGSNRGPFVDRCTRYCGADPETASVDELEWCAAFACYCTGMVLEESGLPNALHPRTLSSGAIVDWSKQHNRIIAPSDIQPGDLGIVKDSTSLTGYRHTTIIEKRISSLAVATIEGNEGNAVRREQRWIDELTFVRPYVLLA